MENRNGPDGSTLNTTPANKAKQERTSRITGIILVVLIAVLIYGESSIMPYLFANIMSYWDISATFYCSPILLFVIAVIPFLYRKKTGWLLLAAYLTYSIVFSAGLLFQAINWRPSEIPLIDNLYLQEFTPITCIIFLVFFGGILWIICKKNFRMIYKVDKSDMLWTFGIMAIIAASLFIYYDKYVK